MRPVPLLLSQVYDVRVRTQPDIVREIVARVIRIEIEHDVVAIPEPVAGIVIVVRRDVEVEPAQVEPLPVATMNAPDMLRTDRLRELAMRPRLSEVVVRVAGAGGVLDPGAGVRVHMRCCRMTWQVECRSRSRGRRRVAARGCRGACPG